MEEIYEIRKNTTYHHVVLDEGKEGIRIVPSDRVIMRQDVSEKDWEDLLKLVD